ncbi:MAG: hypothetical protein LBC48_02380 [Dysgonamonadaceae bacterium]|jgi:hypothetical protein|nr:hypothetical protein [Dysgonamonadaceae bacterium]
MKKNFILKTIFIILLYLNFSAGMSAQLFSKGDKVINLGIGVPVYLGGNGYELKLPLVSGSFDYGLFDGLLEDKASIGVGGYVGYTANRFKYVGDRGYDFSYLIIGPRASFHYNPIDNLDTYGGLLLGLNIVGSSVYGDADQLHKPDNEGGFLPAVYAGARYYFTGNIAVFAEVGYGVSLIEAGLSFKF